MLLCLHVLDRKIVLPVVNFLFDPYFVPLLSHVDALHLVIRLLLYRLL